MLLKKTISGLFILIICSFQLFGQIESTTSGGAWSSIDTWKDHVVPTLNDYVIIKGPVTLSPYNLTEAFSIEIRNLPDAGLAPDPSSTLTNKLFVRNYIWNDGTISGNNLDIYIGGNIGGSIYNLANGTWNSGNLYVVDTLTHAFLSEGIWFSPSSIRADSATLVSAGNIEIDSTTLYARKIILGQNLQNEKMVMDHGAVLRVQNFITLGTSPLKARNFTATGDTSGIEFKNGSYIAPSPEYTIPQFTDTYFKGKIIVYNDIILNGNCFLNGIMYPRMIPSFIPYLITINGSFQNNGEIKSNPTYLFWLDFDVNGDIINNGPWHSGDINLLGTGEHIISTNPNFTFESFSFSALSSTVTVKTVPLNNSKNSELNGYSYLRLDSTIAEINKLVLEPSSSLYLVSSSLAVKDLVGNGNEVKLLNNASLYRSWNWGNSLFEDVNLTGDISIDSDISFTGDCYINGNMYASIGSGYHIITTFGQLQNNGEIGSGLNFEINGDIENTGVWLPEETKLIGNTDQHVGLADTSSFNNIKFSANRGGNSFQWELNGNPLSNGGDISGATSNILTINNFDSNYYGTLKCEIDSSGNAITSRDIVVNDLITEVEIDNGNGNGKGDKDNNKNQIPKIFALSQNYPNPFNPSTIIKYSIPAAVETGYIPSVQLRIYDILGREIAVLVNEQQKPGYYKVNFDASNLSSGIYFYRISAGQFVSVKKMMLLK